MKLLRLDSSEDGDDDCGAVALHLWAHLKVFHNGARLLCGSLLAVNSGAQHVDAMRLVCNTNASFGQFKEAAEELQRLDPKPNILDDGELTDLCKTVSEAATNCIKPVMAVMAKKLVTDEENALSQSHLENMPTWPQQPPVLCHAEVKNKREVATACLERAYRSSHDMLDLLQLSGDEKRVFEINFRDVCDQCRRELAKFYGFQRATFAQIDAGPIEEQILFAKAWARHVRKFHETIDVLRTVADDMPEATADDVKAYVKHVLADASTQSEDMLKLWCGYNEYMLIHIKNFLPTLYPAKWLESMTDEYNKDEVKAFINSNETSHIGKSAGCSWVYLEQLEEFAATLPFLCGWWSKVSVEAEETHADFTQAKKATRQARVALCGAKAAKLIFFKSAKMDKKAKKMAVSCLKDQVKTAKVEDIFPDELTKLLSKM